MPRFYVLFARTIIAAYVLGVAIVFFYKVAPGDGNLVDLKICCTAFVLPYLLMGLLTLTLTRTRKFDLALVCAAGVSTVLLIQMAISQLSGTTAPQASQVIASILGILSYILPMCVAKIRGEVRRNIFVAKYTSVRRMVTPSPFNIIT